MRLPELFRKGKVVREVVGEVEMEIGRALVEDGDDDAGLCGGGGHLVGWVGGLKGSSVRW